MIWWPGRKQQSDPQIPDEEPEPVEIAGPAHIVTDRVDATGYEPGDPGQELLRLSEAVGQVEAFLTGLGLQSASFTEVFRTQNAILRDITWRRAAEAAIFDGVSAPDAVLTSFHDISGIFDAVPDQTLKGRGTDVRSLSRLIRSALVSAPLRRPEPAAPSVWVVAELDAATAMQLSKETCVGVVTTSLLTSGHGIEIAESKGIPYLAGQGDADQLLPGEDVIFG